MKKDLPRSSLKSNPSILARLELRPIDSVLNVMPYKVASLKISVGPKHAEIVLRDVQLWDLTEQDHGQLPLSRDYRCSFAAYVDMRKLPLWLRHSASHFQCFTRSSTTTTYFNSKLKYNHRGIVVKCIPREKMDPGRYEYFTFYREDNSVHAIGIDLAVKRNIDTQIKQLKSTNTVSTEQTDEDTDGGEDAEDNNRESNIEKIVTVTRQKSENATSKVLQCIREKDRKIQLKDTISKLILAGLRLRALSGTHSETQRIYKMTLSAAEFAHRNDIIRLQRGAIKEIPLENMQETVESLLNLFTKT